MNHSGDGIDDERANPVAESDDVTDEDTSVVEWMGKNRQEFKRRLLDLIARPSDGATRRVLERLALTSTGKSVALFPGLHPPGTPTVFSHDHPSAMSRAMAFDRGSGANETEPSERWKAVMFSEELKRLTMILVREGFDELTDLAGALWQRAAQEREWFDEARDTRNIQLAGEAYAEMVRTVSGQGVDHAHAMKDWGLLSRAFGDRVQREVCSVSMPIKDGPPATLKHILRNFSDRTDLSWDVLRAFSSWMSSVDARCAAAILQRGWAHLGTIREVTDDEWCDYAEMKRTLHKQRAAGTEPAQQVDVDVAAIERFLGELAHAPDVPATLRTLTEKLECDRHRADLARLRRLSPVAVAAKEKAIAEEFFSAVVLYPYAAHAPQTSEPPSFLCGLPASVVRQRVITCSTGPWLLAAMLLKAGIPAKQLFYCNVLDSRASSWSGSHGTLALATSQREIWLYDTTSLTSGHQLRTLFCNPSHRRSLLELLEGTSNRVLTFSIDEETADNWRIPRRMQIAPLMTGFQSTNMLHVGHTFAAEEKRDEAKRAWELGLCFNPDHPDLLHMMGIEALRDGSLDEAHSYLDRSLTVHPKHLAAHFTKGELLLRAGDTASARSYFQTIAAAGKQIWGDDGGIKRRAMAYASLDDDAMLRAWRSDASANT